MNKQELIKKISSAGYAYEDKLNFDNEILIPFVSDLDLEVVAKSLTSFGIERSLISGFLAIRFSTKKA